MNIIFDLLSIFIPLAVGTIFFIFGLKLGEDTKVYKKKGFPIQGHIVAFEKRVSTFKNSNGTGSRRAAYYPIIKFPTNSGEALLLGEGEVSITKRIGETVLLSTLDHSAVNTRLITNRTSRISQVCYGAFAMGLVMTGINIYQNFEIVLQNKILMIACLAGVATFAASFLRKINENLKRKPNSNLLPTDFLAATPDLITTNEQIETV